ncbi:unnamed protein product [Prorocentrum cordatum]|uniref:Uncharacterized protein n=1 Tax=Prorocentrum cordatum TaxID=2364126 RepID=A0ABN9S4W9_9DINO|nr:unnamed protein product [Polarella glacialis]
MSRKRERSRDRPDALADEPRESKRGSAFRARQKAREEFLRAGSRGFPDASLEFGRGAPARQKAQRTGPGGSEEGLSPRRAERAAGGGPVRLGSTEKPFQASSATVAEVPWLSSGLRIRIVDEAGPFKEHYLKKGLVRRVDADSMTAHVDVDGGPTVKAVPQRVLETVVSKGCAQVEIVRGPHRGNVVTLIERDAKRNLAIVMQGANDTSRLEVALDDVCEFKH